MSDCSSTLHYGRCSLSIKDVSLLTELIAADEFKKAFTEIRW